MYETDNANTIQNTYKRHYDNKQLKSNRGKGCTRFVKVGKVYPTGQ